MIQVKDLCYEIGSFALRSVSLRVSSNEYFVLLGPTGSGKSLFLKNICGLIRARSGSIQIDGQDVTRLEPRLRKVGYVPQDAGLFPHMNVEKNITFSLRVQRVPKRKTVGMVGPLIDMLKLGPLLKRSPIGLSGGERQKVALARALAIRPKVLLLDEPVSALDEPTRQHVCDELRRVQKELQVATIHVSHNTEEALAVSNRAGVVNAGELIQCGTMEELLRLPKNEIVARFLRVENIFAGTAAPCGGGSSLVSFSGHKIRIPQCCTGNIQFMVRPESLRVSRSATGESNSISAVLKRIDNRGAYCRLEFEAGAAISVYTQPDAIFQRFTPGERYDIIFPPEAIHVFPE